MKVVPTHKEELVLLEGIRKGESKAINSLYEKYYPGIKKYVESNSGGEDDAMDIFQDATMVLYKKLKDPDFELTSSAYTFLYAVARNLWLKVLKKRRTQGVTSDTENVSTSEEEIENAIFQKEKYDLFRKKLNQLGEGCQQILRLFFDGKSMKEISTIMSISEKYARKRKFQCKEKLIDSIKSDPVYRELRPS